MKFDNSPLYYIFSNIRGMRYLLYDVAKWRNGLAFKNIDFSETGKPIIKIAELNNGITKGTALSDKEYSDEVHLTKGDLIFSWSGNPQTSIDIFWYDLPDGWLNQHIFKVTPNESLIDKNFLYYVMKWLKPNLTAIATNKQTTGLGHVTLADLKKISIILPSIDVQRRMVSVVKAIDDKIANNNAINNNLQQQAEALFADNFLNLSDCPHGWCKGNLLEIADYLNGLAMQKFRPKEGENGLPVLKIKELRQGFCDTDSELCSSSIRSDYLVHDGDVIFSWSGSLIMDFWCGGDCGLNQHLFKVTSTKYEPWFYYLWTKYHLAKFVTIAADKATTMGHIKREDLAKSEVLIPSASDYCKIGDTLRPLLSTIINNRIENKKLENLRDTLLPKLMSGEIDVSKVD